MNRLQHTEEEKKHKIICLCQTNYKVLGKQTFPPKQNKANAVGKVDMRKEKAATQDPNPGK